MSDELVSGLDTREGLGLVRTGFEIRTILNGPLSTLIPEDGPFPYIALSTEFEDSSRDSPPVESGTVNVEMSFVSGEGSSFDRSVIVRYLDPTSEQGHAESVRTEDTERNEPVDGRS